MCLLGRRAPTRDLLCNPLGGFPFRSLHGGGFTLAMGPLAFRAPTRDESLLEGHGG
jgi:hypothetical protein